MPSESKSDDVTVHVVSHTHWDREWYLPATRFRQRLVALVDELLDAPPPEGTSFLLDGQMVVVDDYLDVRPDRADELRELMGSGRIEAGPWYVLADELIPGGEALVRNLLAGRRALRALGVSSPNVLYCPDSFGHPAALPALAGGFGLGAIVVSRGFGGARWPAVDAARWEAPSGDSAVLYHLSRKGYDIGENLPTDPAAARARWAAMRDDLLDRQQLGVALLPNGADHHARQTRLDEAVAALAGAAWPARVRHSALSVFAADLLERARGRTLADVRGELRDSYGWMWTLQGTFATRAYQKRRNAGVERLLVRDAEPWAALARVRGGADRSPLIRAAWKSVLLCHPHDTICGCSTDEVARAADVRFDEALAQGQGIRDDALHELIGYSADHAREHRDAWQPMVVVRNPAPRRRSGVAVLRVTSFVSDVKVGANASPGAVEMAKPATPAISGALARQTLGRRIEHERTESPRHYPDDDLVLISDVATWVDDVPAYGIRCLPHRRGGRDGTPPNPARAEGTRISNGRAGMEMDASGRVTILVDGTPQVRDALVWESRTDLGDLYTASVRESRFAPVFRGARVVHSGPLRAAIEARWTFGPPRERVDVRVTFAVDADSPVVRIRIDGSSRATDHRLRMAFRTGLHDAAVVADATFGPVERRSPAVSPTDAAFEQPPRTDPLHRYVSLFTSHAGVTLFSDGLGEYEASSDGTVFVTLMRSVGELSRGDLPERPGHAGWPTPTPGAQCIGPFGAELALMVHGPRSDPTIDAIERAADDFLLPLTGATLRSATSSPGTVPGIALEGTGLACSTITDGESDGWIVLRCVNLTGSAKRGAWISAIPFSDARLARLDQTPEATLIVAGGRIEFDAGPHAIVTVLAR